MKRGHCPICGCFKKNKLFERDFSCMREIMPFLKYTVYECCECGFVYAGDINEAMPLSQYYDLCSKYNEENYYASTNSNKRFEMISEIFEEKIDKNSAILEIGCAEGFLLRTLGNRGYTNLHGLEPSSQCVSFAKNELNLDVAYGGIGNMNCVKHKRFDVIILEQVLEHIDDPKAAILEMKKYLNEDGIICIGVPDAGGFLSNVDFYRQFSSEHINYFSEGAMTNLLNVCGFSKIQVVRNTDEGTFISLWKVDGRSHPVKIEYDISGSEGVKTYISKNALYTEKLREKWEMLKDKLSKYNGKYNVWGGGTYTATLVQMGIIDASDVISVIDTNRNFTGKKVLGKKIIQPKDINNNNPILISVYSNTVSSVKSDIKKYGFKNQIIEF